MKRAWMIPLLLLFLLGLTPCAYAMTPRVVDEAGLLTGEEARDLEIRTGEISEKYGMDVVILTVSSLDGWDSEAYADDYYDSHGYGLGTESSGVLLLLSMEYRDWAISTCGEAVYALTDYGIQDVFSQISRYLADDEYYDAFDAYLEALEVYFDAYAQGNPIDGWTPEYEGPGTYLPGTREDVVYPPEKVPILRFLLVGLAAGAAAAGITVAVLAGQMKTARPQPGAQDYLQPGTDRLYDQQTIFLHSHVSRTPKPEANSGGGSHGGGGSSIHHSSGGSSHGGGHGKF